MFALDKMLIHIQCLILIPLDKVPKVSEDDFVLYEMDNMEQESEFHTLTGDTVQYYCTH